MKNRISSLFLSVLLVEVFQRLKFVSSTGVIARSPARSRTTKQSRLISCMSRLSDVARNGGQAQSPVTGRGQEGIASLSLAMTGVLNHSHIVEKFGFARSNNRNSYLSLPFMTCGSPTTVHMTTSAHAASR